MKSPKPVPWMICIAAALWVKGVAPDAKAAADDYVYQYGGSPVRAGVTGTCVRSGFWEPGTNDPCGNPVPAKQPSPPVTQTVPTPAAKQPSPPVTQAAPITAAPQAAEPAPVPEFVSEPEPPDMVPVPPMTPAWRDDGIAASTIYYDEEPTPVSGDGIVTRTENRNFDDEVAASAAQTAQPPTTPADRAAPPVTSAPSSTVTSKAIAEAAAAPNHLTLDAETYFTFNKSDLTALGQQRLDKMVRALNGADYESIVVRGHTDRMGTDAYNQKLSERRALEVKRYLGTKGIDANKIQTKWVGSAEPQTPPGACEGMKRTETIACLAPDRRVELEVIGIQQPSSAGR